MVALKHTSVVCCFGVLICIDHNEGGVQVLCIEISLGLFLAVEDFQDGDMLMVFFALTTAQICVVTEVAFA